MKKFLKEHGFFVIFNAIIIGGYLAYRINGNENALNLAMFVIWGKIVLWLLVLMAFLYNSEAKIPPSKSNLAVYLDLFYIAVMAYEGWFITAGFLLFAMITFYFITSGKETA
ncbi:hypothetical protein NB636_01085 [Oxalobacter aliiformigenes]|uniref:hypothetical protein n=1 Tax=Oxalobacter aliiformigenes TaxID=2946593 RepID=UPI0022AFDE2B|nr:hypothetical protein [Oxalobacter aliiformigenes]MCZ4064109.1 hypothetical protein [Oxalobacter aliiformigenes]WAV99485.1 hypothetical protein NB636_01085 [Oxalobacter aliiformigenes]